MTPGLYIVGTPIGNLDDLAPRAIQTLREVGGVLSEDTRRTAVLLQRFGIKVPLISCHKFNEAARLGEILQRLEGGAALALVSDSGMPLVSDPGARLVSACHEHGIPVTVIPGPSAVTAAVALAGFGGAGFVFQGFLPRKPGVRARRLAELFALEQPAVVFESPFRIVKLVEEMVRIDAGRRILVGRELTKKFEEYFIGGAGDVLARLGGRTLKGEFVVVIAPSFDRVEAGCYPPEPLSED
jgi:16S rRNA (cytidine1402-2'-O)-methyltransferase